MKKFDFIYNILMGIWDFLLKAESPLSAMEIDDYFKGWQKIEFIRFYMGGEPIYLRNS